MNIAFSVQLPVDAKSVPLVRGLLRQALEHIGVVENGIDELVLALTEACANVVQHAGEHDLLDPRLDHPEVLECLAQHPAGQRNAVRVHRKSDAEGDVHGNPLSRNRRDLPSTWQIAMTREPDSCCST